MARIMGRFLLLLLLVLPSSIMLAGNGAGSSILVSAEDGKVEDQIEDEEETEATVETEDPPAGDAAETATTAEADDEEDKPLKPSTYADTVILFTKYANHEFPAGTMVKFLVGFSNNGDGDFTVETMDASFRYPQDYSFYIQNFTTVRYDRVVEPARQATFEYAFTPSDTFSARPFGLTINLHYKDNMGNVFQEAVFNDTINITEADEGLDGETFFLYVFLAAISVLLLVGAQQLLASFGVNTKKRLSRPKQQIEMGTQNKGNIDYDWLPKETLEGMNKSPRRSPRQSPGRRRTKRGTGASED